MWTFKFNCQYGCEDAWNRWSYKDFDKNPGCIETLDGNLILELDLTFCRKGSTRNDSHWIYIDNRNRHFRISSNQLADLIPKLGNVHKISGKFQIVKKGIVMTNYLGPKDGVNQNDKINFCSCPPRR